MKVSFPKLVEKKDLRLKEVTENQTEKENHYLDP